jgi:hypothetical protein
VPVMVENTTLFIAGRCGAKNLVRHSPNHA